jgi:hypothetical protein
MVKCSRCKKRKAKRFCPGLGRSLCNLCCGQIRQREIQCPPGCPYLSKHASYQKKRTIEKKTASYHRPSPEEENILEDERLAWLAFQTEHPIKEYGEKNSALTDKEALLAFEYAREKVKQEKSLLFIPEEKDRPQNSLGEAVYQAIEKSSYEGRIILTGSSQKYTKEEKLRVLDRVIGAVNNLARGNIEGRGYIQSVLDRFSKIHDLSRQKKIITPP